MAGIFPVDVGPQYEGEVIRKNDMHVRACDTQEQR
jgi:CO dehydrogenase/acetyl-CoA synthase beta subunit